jgi:hypothetical protein
VIADVSRPFSATGQDYAISGWVEDRVVRTQSGTVDFYYRVKVDDSSAPSRA